MAVGATCRGDRREDLKARSETSWSGSCVRLRFLRTLPLRVKGLIPPLGFCAEVEVEGIGGGYVSSWGGGGGTLGSSGRGKSS